MSQLTDRMINAAKLDPRLYEEVEKDEKAMGQAMSVVLLSSLAAGIGSIQSTGIAGIFIGTLTALISWYIWAFLTYWIGTKLLPEPGTKSSHKELLRTIGFSSAPGMIRIAGIIPGLAWITILIGGIWMLVAMVVAVRQALDYSSTFRAVGVCLIGWVIQIFIIALLFSIFGASNPSI